MCPGHFLFFIEPQKNIFSPRTNNEQTLFWKRDKKCQARKFLRSSFNYPGGGDPPTLP
jgi:hypothetical protein